MKKIIALLLFGLITMSSSFAFAALTDNRAAMAALYGEYRFVIDEDKQLWSKAEWEAKGHKKAKANSYIHYFRRDGLGFQLEVQYEGNSPDSFVRAQRITPDMGIKAYELKSYLPEIYQLVVNPEAKAFGTTEKITRNFRDDSSPVILGVVLKQPLSRAGSTQYTLLSFNIREEGRLVKDEKDINRDTYIHEILVERKFYKYCESSAWKYFGKDIFN